ncbi:MAG: amidohydrolase [Alphaproteobacteria bacterium]|nr:amidohydrolase [Alphaproteobacteria bacterium]
MTKRNSIPPMKEEFAAYRRELHQNPGLMYEEHFSKEMVEKKLSEWGIPFRAGLGKTGIVAIIEGQKNTSGKTIGIRADMDALPIEEASNQPWASKTKGLMHACGHDGHTATLLGVAKYLKETRNFNGRAILIFQPAEEGGRGAFAMMKDGLFEGDLKCDAVYAYHNWPYQPIGTAGIRSGAIMASVDNFDIAITGRSGHAAYPHNCIDPVMIGASLVTQLQSIVARNVPPQECAVLSVTNFNAGTGAYNIIPDTAKITGTVRTLSPATRDLVEARMKTICEEVGKTHNAKIDFHYDREIDPTINDARHTDIIADAAARVLGNENVYRDIEPSMGGEDFGGMLAKVPGAYIRIGQGVPGKDSPHNRGLHNSGFDFNDDILPIAIDVFVEVIESQLPLE